MSRILLACSAALAFPDLLRDREPDQVLPGPRAVLPHSPRKPHLQVLLVGEINC